MAGLGLLTPGMEPGKKCHSQGQPPSSRPRAGGNPRLQPTWKPPKRAPLRNPAKGSSSPATKDKRALCHQTLIDLWETLQVKEQRGQHAGEKTPERERSARLRQGALLHTRTAPGPPARSRGTECA